MPFYLMILIFIIRALLALFNCVSNNSVDMGSGCVERLLLTPEIRGTNPDIGKILSTNSTTEKTKIKKKRPGMAHLRKTIKLIL